MRSPSCARFVRRAARREIIAAKFLDLAGELGAATVDP
jgi:hypothetical protein